ncbi:hypothetical protein [Methanobacterium sp.]|uniref:hypothetical protein n=1 Tax=Methanobacterium sp. TaxID=2164 RepID=UPI003C7536C5
MKKKVGKPIILIIIIVLIGSTNAYAASNGLNDNIVQNLSLITAKHTELTKTHTHSAIPLKTTANR